jgi:predicted nucleic acid-binding protein
MILCDTNILIELSRLHKAMSIPDALIAATALEPMRTALYTLNVKDFYFISKLTLYSPVVD